ncbi:MAG TPA: NUDIX hydrolase [Acidimicrobiales bacterium]
MTARPREYGEAYLDWMRAEADAGAPLIPAATVVLLRDGASGPETLLLRRNAAVEFAGGMWVFPGGRIDPDDHVDGGDLLGAARNACVREALEEAGQQVDVDSLVWFAHWCPPQLAKKRFATFFFACRATGDHVTIDGSEIHEHEWMRPADALARHRAKQIELAPPTWMTLHDLCSARDVDHALARWRAASPRFYETHVARDGTCLYFLWEPDAAWETGDLNAPGPRHRVAARPDGWVLERDDDLAPDAQR